MSEEGEVKIKTLLLTQSSPPDPSFIAQCEVLGFACVHCPVLSISYHEAPLSFDFTPQTLVVTSKHALHFIHTYALDTDIRVLCVGHTTKEALVRKGFKNISHVFETGEGLIEYLPHAQDVLFLRGQDVQHDLSSVCQTKGIQFQEHVVYHSSFMEELSQDVRLRIIQDQDIVLSVFSSKGATALVHLIEHHNLENKIIRTNLLCLSERMIKSLDHFGWGNRYVCDHPTQQDFLECLKNIKETGRTA